VGWIPEHDLPRYLASCDVYVSTALSDGGLAASTAEAMACGLPVIVTDVGDNAEWVQEGVQGFIVPPKDPSALAWRLASLLERGEERARLGRSGRALIEERNNWTAEMHRMEEYYRNLIARGVPAQGRPAG
jgi:glycosyltransferase involved in cell wall biosynthesis